MNASAIALARNGIVRGDKGYVVDVTSVLCLKKLPIRLRISETQNFPLNLQL
jgi:hypothetical protein